MDEAKKVGASPGSASVSPEGSGSSLAGSAARSGSAEDTAPAKRRPRLSGEPGKNPAIPRNRVRKDTNEFKFEAIRLLSNLVEGGKFFLLVETPDGKKDTVNCWN